MASQWYSYIGSNPTIPASYTPAGATPPTCSTPTQQLCAIFTEEVDGKPNLNLIALEMVQALQNQVNTTNVKLKERI